jgi:hypothetical protein
VVRRGERGEWDSSQLVIGRAVDYKDHFFIYYSGVSENWSSWPSDNANVNADKRKRQPGWIYPAQMGLATLRLDGLTHLQARDGMGPGIVTTIPLQVEGAAAATLRVNASELVPFRDWVEVEILDAKTGAPVAGYSREDCEDVTTDGTSIAVDWKRSGKTLRSVPVPQIKLRFYLHGRAKLHSFHFEGTS